MTFDSELIHVFVMFYNRILNIIPLIIYPDKPLEKKEELMLLIKYHPIWYLDFDDCDVFEHIDIKYKEKIYCAKKFKIFLKRSQIRSVFDDETPANIVIIIVVPEKLKIYRLQFLNIVSEIILSEKIQSLYKIIESEILKENLIRTEITKNLINIGDSLKIEIKRILKNIWDSYFQKFINHSQRRYFLNSSIYN